MKYFVCRKAGAQGIPTEIIGAETFDHFWNATKGEFEVLGSFDTLAEAQSYVLKAWPSYHYTDDKKG